MKGIIIAAGYGTRFLPCTKTVPKEMFPLVDTPAIDLIVKEFEKSGIKDILIVTSRRKKVLEDYFDREVELETLFTAEKAESKLEKIKIREGLNIYFTRQEKMSGTGHAIMICKSFIGNDPFVIAYPDDIVFSETPLARQLMDVHEKTGESVLAVQSVTGDVSRYGVIDYTEQQKKGSTLCQVNSIVEKPPRGTEPSHMISIGRYLFTPELLKLLEENYRNHSGGEFYHIDSINQLAASGKMYALPYSGKRIDVGDKLGYLEGIIEYALTRDDLKEDTKKLLKKYSGLV